MLQVKLVRSLIGNTKSNRLTVAALGLRKMHQTVELPDNPSVRGMIHKVKHMLQVVQVEEVAEQPVEAPKKTRAKKAAEPAEAAE